MTYEIFKQECWEELQEQLDINDEKTSQIIATNEPTIKGCYEREMTSEDTILLILGGK